MLIKLGGGLQKNLPPIFKGSTVRIIVILMSFGSSGFCSSLAIEKSGL